MAPPTAVPVPPSTKPVEYWKDPALNLANGAIDNKYATAHKKTATVPHNYVSDLQKDLITLGYLKAGSDDGSYGKGTEGAIKQLQRHARRTVRMKDIALQYGAWGGSITGVCDYSTALEVRSWITNGFTRPVGYNPLVKIDGGKLREDVAKLWQTALDDVTTKGAILLPPGKGASDYYSDTWRNPANGFKSTGGNSKLSLHYTGRAIDLSMEPAGGKGQRWWVVKETVDGSTYWRIYCKVDKDDGTQGEKIAAKTKNYYEFWKNTGEKPMPAGYYVDLTAFLSEHEFERIPAQVGWETVAKKAEWWHFYYAKDVQETFLDEMEAVGYTEDQLLKWGWTAGDLEKKPG